MKKFLNNPEAFVDEMLDGIYRAHPEVTYAAGDLRCYVTANPVPGKVGIVTGGGSGHLPTFLGFVGETMLDGCAVGGVFQSPSSDQILEVTKYVDQGAGVLYLYGNYTGDIMNFDMAGELAELEDIATRTVMGNDDVASSVVGEEHKRRGVAGIFFLYKAAGAAAARMLPLEEVARIADKARARTRTMGVALSPCIVPEVGKPGFEIGENEMEIGMGIHGEPGYLARDRSSPADEVVDTMMAKIFAETDYNSGDEVAVLLNGLGGHAARGTLRPVPPGLDPDGGTRREDPPLLARRVCHVDGDGRGVDLGAAPRRRAGAADCRARRTRRSSSTSRDKTMALTAEQMRSLYTAWAERFAAEREALIALDGKVGDSDLGITMSKGFAAANEAVQGLEGASVAGQMKAAGAALAKAAPSTMGTLMATGFLRGFKALEGAEQFGTAEAAAFWRAYADGVAQRGKAQLGDKTVLDVLDPIAAALEGSDVGLSGALEAAAEAAAEALEATKLMVAQHGKAAAFQEKSRGLPDAGGTVALILIEVMRDVARDAAQG